MARRSGCTTARFFLLVVSAGSLPACTTLEAYDRIDPVVEARALSSAAEQVRRCYRSPRIPWQGRQIVTHLRVHYGGDGNLLGLPRLLGQEGVTPANRIYAERMAQAAIESVLRCSPVTTPRPMQSGPWQIDYTFSITAAV